MKKPDKIPLQVSLPWPWELRYMETSKALLWILLYIFIGVLLFSCAMYVLTGNVSKQILTFTSGVLGADAIVYAVKAGWSPKDQAAQNKKEESEE